MQRSNQHGPTADARTRALERFTRLAGAAPTVIARAPGRVNLIGEHTDYSEGFVLPVAVNADLVICARARADDNIRIVSADASFESQFKIGNHPFQRSAQYVGGVAALLSAATGVKTGADLVLSSDVPSGVGLSSSAALEVATARALLRLWQADLPVRDIVTLCRRAELEWAGVQCGVMDQAIVAMAVEGHGLLLDCRSLDARPVPIPENAAILVVDSGADRSLASSAYNDRVRETKEAAERLGVPALRDADSSSVEQLPETLRRRARHVISENTRALAFASSRELRERGSLMSASHTSLRDDFEVSSPALDAIFQAANSIDGVYGAKLTGAGFGGCVVLLADAEQAEAVAAALLSRVTARSVYRFQPAGGASAE